MAAILAAAIFNCFFLNENDRISSQIPATTGSSNGLAPDRRQAITWTNDDPVHWRIYAVLGLGGGGGGWGGGGGGGGVFN